MMPCALPVECGVPDMQVTIAHMSSSSLDLFPGISGPMSQNSNVEQQVFFLGHQAANGFIPSSCLHHFVQPRTNSGWQLNHQETQLLWRMESAIIELSSSMMTMRKNFRCCSWMQLDAAGVSLFRHRIAIAATRSCSVRHWTAGQTDVPHVTVVHGGSLDFIPRSLPSLGHTQVVNSNSGTQELASEQRVVISCNQLWSVVISMSDLACP